MSFTYIALCKSLSRFQVGKKEQFKTQEFFENKEFQLVFDSPSHLPRFPETLALLVTNFYHPESIQLN